MITHCSKKASAFVLVLVLLFSMIPSSSVYAADERVVTVGTSNDDYSKLSEAVNAENANPTNAGKDMVFEITTDNAFQQIGTKHNITFSAMYNSVEVKSDKPGIQREAGGASSGDNYIYLTGNGVPLTVTDIKQTTKHLYIVEYDEYTENQTLHDTSITLSNSSVYYIHGIVYGNPTGNATMEINVLNGSKVTGTVDGIWVINKNLYLPGLNMIFNISGEGTEMTPKNSTGIIQPVLNNGGYLMQETTVEVGNIEINVTDGASVPAIFGVGTATLRQPTEIKAKNIDINVSGGAVGTINGTSQIGSTGSTKHRSEFKVDDIDIDIVGSTVSAINASGAVVGTNGNSSYRNLCVDISNSNLGSYCSGRMYSYNGTNGINATSTGITSSGLTDINISDTTVSTRVAGGAYSTYPGPDVNEDFNVKLNDINMELTNISGSGATLYAGHYMSKGTEFTQGAFEVTDDVVAKISGSTWGSIFAGRGAVNRGDNDLTVNGSSIEEHLLGTYESTAARTSNTALHYMSLEQGVKSKLKASGCNEVGALGGFTDIELADAIRVVGLEVETSPSSIYHGIVESSNAAVTLTGSGWSEGDLVIGNTSTSCAALCGEEFTKGWTGSFDMGYRGVSGSAIEGWYLDDSSTGPGPGPGPGPTNPTLQAIEHNVEFDLGSNGTSNDTLTYKVEKGKSVPGVPRVTPNEGYTFDYWSLSEPTTENPTPAAVDPVKHIVNGNTVFYAVYKEGNEHKAYMKGLEGGKFGPDLDITRAEVAMIFARALTEGFVEESNYGDGGYSDITGTDHWAKSAIAYCSDKNIFIGTDKGTFEPGRNITREEFMLALARVKGVVSSGAMAFSDAWSISNWARDGVYTTYLNRWVDGYEDGTLKPQRNISRSEVVKVVNLYLNRGVDDNGLKDIDFKGWPDVESGYWAYHHIIEASNDHLYFYRDDEAPPEDWIK